MQERAKQQVKVLYQELDAAAKKLQSKHDRYLLGFSLYLLMS